MLTQAQLNKRRKHKKKQHHSFMHNLVEDVKSLGGIPAGIYALGKAQVGDTKALATGGRNKKAMKGRFLLDDYLKSAGRQMADYYSPLVHGDLRKFGRNVHEHPLQLGLDALTVATGGGGLAAKVGVGLARGAEAGSAAARLGEAITGLERVKGGARGLSKEALLAHVAEGNKVSRGGDLLLAPKRVIRTAKDSDNNIAELPTSLNPIIRGRKAGVESLLSKAESRGMLPQGMRAGTRIDRYNRGVANRAAARTAAQASTAFAESLKKLNKQERLAVRGLAAGWHPKEYAEFLDRQVARGEIKGKEAIRAKVRADKFRDARVLAAADNPSKKVLRAVDEAKKLSRGFIEERLKYHKGEGFGDSEIARRATQEQRLIKTKAKNKDVAIFTHMIPKDKSAKIGEALWNTQEAFKRGLNSDDPRVLLDTVQRFVKEDALRRRYEQMMKGAVEITPGDSLRYKRGKVVGRNNKLVGLRPHDKAFKDVAETDKFLSEEAPLVYASDNEAMKRLHDAFLRQHRGEQALVEDRNAAEVPLGVDKDMWESFIRGIAPSGGFARAIDKPTQIWRDFTLALRPAWMVNNAVGQGTLGMLSAGPVGFARGVGAQFGKKGKLLSKYEPDLARTGFFKAHAGGTFDAKGGKLGKIVKFTPDTMGKLNSYLTDNIPRRAVFIRKLDKLVKEVRREHKAAGHGDISWEKAAESILSNEKAIDKLTVDTIGDLVDFTNLTDFERRYLRRAIPFYSWLRGMGVRGAQITADTPWISEGLIGVGNIGIEDTKKQLGEIPSYLRSALVLSDKAYNTKQGPAKRIMTTQGLNPFSTIADEAGMFGSLVDPSGPLYGAENPLTAVNPIFRSPIEVALNRDAFMGKTIDQKGDQSFGGKLLKQYARGFPQVVLAGKMLPENQFIHSITGPAPKNSAFVQGTYDPLYGYLGLPMKQLRMGRARQLAMLEQAQKKGGFF